MCSMPKHIVHVHVQNLLGAWLLIRYVSHMHLTTKVWPEAKHICISFTIVLDLPPLPKPLIRGMCSRLSKLIYIFKLAHQLIGLFHNLAELEYDEHLK